MTTRKLFFQKALAVAGTLSLTPLVSKAISEDISEALLSLDKLLHSILSGTKNYGQSLIEGMHCHLIFTC